MERGKRLETKWRKKKESSGRLLFGRVRTEVEEVMQIANQVRGGTILQVGRYANKARGGETDHARPGTLGFPFKREMCSQFSSSQSEEWVAARLCKSGESRTPTAR